ncbi:hypothetical protein [Holophaga foetida]|uniref:hypothetical protein n=1 Tax=Holophaga foetida TaxID=35839 RepID=UPI00130E4C86|nr:hypothetical protein [Holophaga foetida]
MNLSRGRSELAYSADEGSLWLSDRNPTFVKGELGRSSPPNPRGTPGRRPFKLVLLKGAQGSWRKSVQKPMRRASREAWLREKKRGAGT